MVLQILQFGSFRSILTLLLAWSHCNQVSSASSSSPLSNGPWGPTNPVANPAATVIVPGYQTSQVRVTVLTDRLLRIEQSSDDGKWEDRKTIAIINRNLTVPWLEHSLQNDTLTLQTKCLTLTYHVGTEFHATTLQIQGTMYCDTTSPTIAAGNRHGESWVYHYGDQDAHNLLGTIRTLDVQDAVNLNCSLRNAITDHCEWGLMSRSGFAILNESKSFVLSDDDDWWQGTNRNQQDIYVLGHGHDYAAALSDYRQVGGAIPLVPRYALGVWFSQWYDYTAASAAAMVQDYEWHALPLDVFVLDMNWHTKNDWTGYSWDRRLFGSGSHAIASKDAVAYIKSRGVAVTMNLHDAKGVNPWEDQYSAMCRAVSCQEGHAIPFSMVNQTIVYALEDVVLQPLEQDNGIDFWWIDWQQGEQGPGGAAGGKQNPTIWTAHIRSTNANRRRNNNNNNKQEDDTTTVRNMVLARWGGLGAHRYPVHFSGDVAHLSWDDLAYQPYFSMTATNVGAIWSHDIEGPSQDPELYTRWLQWGVVSGVMRSHDRGMSSGPCAVNNPMTCSIVVPWNAAPPFVKANLEALRLRGSLIPYLYTAAYTAHTTGLWFITPMYYNWPELDGAYETASPRPNSNATYDSQYMFGNDMWVAPVVSPANKTTGLARMNLWIPPGTWVGVRDGQVLTGKEDGTSSTTYDADLTDIPMFARAGSVIPSIPVRPGATIGLAMKPFDELIWTVYLASGGPTYGSGTVYEDDGITTAYHERDSFTITTATFNITTTVTSNRLTRPQAEANARNLGTGRSKLSHQANDLDESTSTLTFAISTSGHCEKLPTSRTTTIRLVNALPPTSVVANGRSIPYARFGGQGTWSYSSQDAAVVLQLPPSMVSEGLQVVVKTNENLADKAAVLDGLGFRLRRAVAAKAELDEIGLTPGSQTGADNVPGYLMLAASTGSALEYLAGLAQQDDFGSLLRSYRSYSNLALHEVQAIENDKTGAVARIVRAQALLSTAI